MKTREHRKPRGYWTKETVLQEILDRKKKGLSLTRARVSTSNTSLLEKACKHYGNWTKALLAAGLTPDDWLERGSVGYWTPVTVIREILKRLESGNSLTPTVMYLEDRSLILRASEHYETWDNALIAAGLDPTDWYKVNPNGYWTKQKVNERLKARLAEGKNLVQCIMHKEDSILYHGTLSVYTTWNDALVALGVEPSDHQLKKPKNYWTKETVTAELLKRKQKGLSLTPSVIDKDHHVLYNNILKCFDTWGEAYLTIDEDISLYRCKREQRKWTKELVLTELLARQEKGEPINATAVNKDDIQLYRNARKFYPDYKAALKAMHAQPTLQKEELTVV